MRKTSIIRFDKERNKWRVDTGKRLNQYVVRTEVFDRARAISGWVDRGYEIGHRDGWDEGFDTGFDKGYEYAITYIRDMANAILDKGD